MLESPIMKFVSQRQLNRCLREWQTRLFLNHWVIKVIVCNPKDLPGAWGDNHITYENNTALIRLVRPTKKTTNKIMKYCMEQVLIHELLHCKYITIKTQHPQIEDICYERVQHELLDQMAKSLIMAKYNLKLKWFYN